MLYSWSVVSKNIPDDWHWSEADRSLPYAAACLSLSLAMFPAGRLQDRIGPRMVATAGGLMMGLGMILSSLGHTPLVYTLGFGLLVGVGMGTGYASTTPPAIKWFPASHVGFIAGIVVAGFGLASVYIAPLAESLIHSQGLPRTMFSLGVGVLVVVSILAPFLKAPPAGYSVPGAREPVVDVGRRRIDFTPLEVLRTWQFYGLWLMYACGGGAGLMVISKLATIVYLQAGVKLGFALVACLGVGSGGGRVLAGLVSDKIGRRATMIICLLMQGVVILLLSQATQENVLGKIPVLILLSALVGANYGSLSTLFPSMTKDYYGLKNFGANYGLVFTSWGMGGFTMSFLAGKVYDQTHTFAFAYYFAVGLLLAGATIAYFMTPPPHLHAPSAS